MCSVLVDVNQSKISAKLKVSTQIQDSRKGSTKFHYNPIKIQQIIQKLRDEQYKCDAAPDLFKITEILDNESMCCSKGFLKIRNYKILNVASCAQVEVNLDVLETQEPILVNGWCYKYWYKRSAYNADDDRDILSYQPVFRTKSPEFASIPSDADGAEFFNAYTNDIFLLHKCQNMYVFILLKDEKEWGFPAFRSGFFMG